MNKLKIVIDIIIACASYYLKVIDQAGPVSLKTNALEQGENQQQSKKGSSSLEQTQHDGTESEIRTRETLLKGLACP